MAKQQNDATRVVCAVCGKVIPPNPANGLITDCIWVDDHYECKECRNRGVKVAVRGGDKPKTAAMAEKVAKQSEPKPKPKPQPKVVAATPTHEPPKNTAKMVREEVAPPPKKPVLSDGWDW